jgi:hypothetical protein
VHVIYRDASRLARSFDVAEASLMMMNGLVTNNQNNYSRISFYNEARVFIHFIEEEVVIDCMGNIPQQMERLRSRYS